MKVLKPMWDRVLIRPQEKIGGIIIPNDRSFTLGRGIVVSVGSAVRQVKPGQEAFFTHPANAPLDVVPWGAEGLVAVPQSSIVAVVTEEEEEVSNGLQAPPY